MYLNIGDVAIYPFDDTPLHRAKCPEKLVELMVARRAIVANRVGQIAEYIQNGESGILVDPNDTTNFALSIVKILKDSVLKKKLGMNCRSRILNSFNWAKLTDEVERAISFETRGSR
jgi:glycosyltransferase involved in cell wall biosynthesis